MLPWSRGYIGLVVHGDAERIYWEILGLRIGGDFVFRNCLKKSTNARLKSPIVSCLQRKSTPTTNMSATLIYGDAIYS